MQKNAPFLTTEELARLLNLRPQTLHAALCRQGGHYYGVRPIKQPNGRWAWPADSFKRLTGVEV